MSDDELRWQERHQALTESLESLTHDVHEMQATQAAMLEAQRRQDERERILREALLRGIAAFLQGLGGEQA